MKYLILLFLVSCSKPEIKYKQKFKIGDKVRIDKCITNECKARKLDQEYGKIYQVAHSYKCEQSFGYFVEYRNHKYPNNFAWICQDHLIGKK
jgi:hypothetical protein